MQTSALRLADGPRLDGVRVLVVNDMRSVRQVVTDILECAGATVTAVDSAEDALEVLQRERPNVLLSGLSIPEGKNGYWLIGQVRALPPERGGTTPAAALTGYTGPEHRASVLRASRSSARNGSGRERKFRRRRSARPDRREAAMLFWSRRWRLNGRGDR